MIIKNDWTDTIDAQREAIKSRDILIESLTQKELELKTELGHCKAVLKAFNAVAYSAIKLKLIG